jgi:surface protein
MVSTTVNSAFDQYANGGYQIQMNPAEFSSATDLECYGIDIGNNASLDIDQSYYVSGDAFTVLGGATYYAPGGVSVYSSTGEVPANLAPGGVDYVDRLTVVRSGDVSIADTHMPQLININAWGNGSTFAFDLDATTAPNIDRVSVTNGPTNSSASFIKYGGNAAYHSQRMFYGASTDVKNQINQLDTSHLTNIKTLLVSGLEYWNYSLASVTSLSDYFSGSSTSDSYPYPIDSRINNWDTSNVTDMSRTFISNDNFNQTLNNWDTSSVTNMEDMFRNSVFNNNISSWDTSTVTNMSGMFNSSLFNQDISGWNVSSVTDMSYMFGDSTTGDTTDFNQDISSWNTGSVTNMESMFNENTAFDQDISGWNVSNVTNATNWDRLTNPNWTSAEKPTFPPGTPT